MAKTPKGKQPFVPQFVVEDIPRAKVGNSSDKRADPTTPFVPIFEQVRGLEGRSALIMHHPDPRDFVRKLKEAFPDFDVVTRTILKDGKPLTAVWARLKAPAAETASPNPLTAPLS